PWYIERRVRPAGETWRETLSPNPSPSAVGKGSQVAARFEMSDDEFYDVTYVVEPNYAGWRLDLYLCEKIQRLSRTRAQFLIKHRVHCEKPLKPSTAVYPGLTFSLRRKVLEKP